MSKVIKSRSSRFTVYITGALLGVAVTFLFFLIFAALITFCGIDRGYSVPLSTIALSLGSFTAAFYVSKKSERKGYLIGILIGVLSFAAVTAVSLIISDSGLTLNTLFHFIVIVLASVIGGIIGVNKRKDKKFI